MNQLIINLSRNVVLRKTFRKLKFNRVYNYWLSKCPRVRKINEIIYRSTRTEAVSLALEILEGGKVYKKEFLPTDFRTFADLGCNVGYFSCWLHIIGRGRKLSGIMVDANPYVINESNWHKNSNYWDTVHTDCGILGGKSNDFYVHEADTVSRASLSDLQNPNEYVKMKIPKIDNFNKLWNSKMGKKGCDVLKIDIEGAELEFLKNETAFLKKVKVAYIEYHKDRVRFVELDALMRKNGFKCKFHETRPEQGDGTTVYIKK